jgi:VanZ family protein
VSQPARTGSVSRAWVVSAIAAILYASYLPYTIDLGALSGSNLVGLDRIALHDTTGEDVVVNLAVYAMLGALLCFYRAQTADRRWARVSFALTIGTLVSVAAEWGQTMIRGRVASWTDVFLNAAGAMVGTLVAPWVLRLLMAGIGTARRALRARPFTLTACALTFGLLVFGLAPFDFVTNTAGMHQSLRAARWNVSYPRYGATTGPPLAMLMTQLTGAAWFAALGYLLSLARREQGEPAPRALGSAIKNGVTLAALIEVLQVFTRSHTFDIGTVALRIVAVGWGAWSGAFLFESSATPPWRRRPQHAAPTALLIVLVVGQIAAMILAVCDLRTVHWASLAGGVEVALPLADLWRNLTARAMVEAASVLIAFAVLATMIAIVVRRRGDPPTGLLVGGLVTLIACAVEFVNGACGSGAIDLTNPVLALLAAAISTRLLVRCSPVALDEADAASPAPAPARSPRDAATAIRRFDGSAPSA